MKFDEAMAQFEETVNKIQDKSTGLDESIALFDKGIELAKMCADFLSENKGKIEELTDKLNGLAALNGDKNE